MKIEKIYTPVPDNSVAICLLGDTNFENLDLSVLSMLRGCSEIICLDKASYAVCKQHRLSSKTEKMFSPDENTLALIASASAANGFSTAVVMENLGNSNKNLISNPMPGFLKLLSQRAYKKEVILISPLSNNIFALLYQICFSLEKSKNSEVSEVIIKKCTLEQIQELLNSGLKLNSWAIAVREKTFFQIITSFQGDFKESFTTNCLKKYDPPFYMSFNIDLSFKYN